MLDYVRIRIYVRDAAPNRYPRVEELVLLQCKAAFLHNVPANADCKQQISEEPTNKKCHDVTGEAAMTRREASSIT